MGRRPCCDKEGLNKGAWTVMEDKVLSDYIKLHGEGKWRDLPQKAGLKRCGKSCRLRWLNYLRPDIRRGNISSEEEDLILRLHKLLGNRWALIAGRLPGRTDNEIKNYWNTNLRKKIVIQSKDKVQNELPFSSTNNNVVRTKAFRCTKAVKIADFALEFSGKSCEIRPTSNSKDDDNFCPDFLSDFDINDFLVMSDMLNLDSDVINGGEMSTNSLNNKHVTTKEEYLVGFGADNSYDQAKPELIDGLIINSGEATMNSTSWSDSDHYQPSYEGFDIDELSFLMNEM